MPVALNRSACEMRGVSLGPGPLDAFPFITSKLTSTELMLQFHFFNIDLQANITCSSSLFFFYQKRLSTCSSRTDKADLYLSLKATENCVSFSSDVPIVI